MGNTFADVHVFFFPRLIYFSDQLYLERNTQLEGILTYTTRFYLTSSFPFNFQGSYFKSRRKFTTFNFVFKSSRKVLPLLVPGTFW